MFSLLTTWSGRRKTENRPLLVRNIARMTDFPLARHPSIVDKMARQRKHLSWCKLHNRL